MNGNIANKLFVALLILVVFGVLIRNFYMAWFRPSKFLESARNGVKDWWPFADYFRSYYGSSWWLWPNRIASTIFVLVILYIIFRVILALL